jgi:hypothetical protein
MPLLIVQATMNLGGIIITEATSPSSASAQYPWLLGKHHHRGD